MSNKTLGENICSLRKEKGVTQEELAKAVGISTQAVSKWECGGLPDSELLPMIADYFNVSIDRLFGRKIYEYSDLKIEIFKHFSELQQEDSLNEVMEYSWVIQRALGGATDADCSLKKIYDENPGGYQHSQMQFDSGFSLLSLTEKMPYWVLMPEPKDGWSEGLFAPDDYTGIFKLLGDSDVLNSLFVLYKRENKPFTPKLFENKLKLPIEKSKRILESLKPYGFIKETEVELDDCIQKVYNFNPNPAFIALLAVAKEIIKRPNALIYFCSSRQKSYL